MHSVFHVVPVWAGTGPRRLRGYTIHAYADYFYFPFGLKVLYFNIMFASRTIEMTRRPYLTGIYSFVLYKVNSPRFPTKQDQQRNCVCVCAIKVS